MDHRKTPDQFTVKINALNSFRDTFSESQLSEECGCCSQTRLSKRPRCVSSSACSVTSEEVPEIVPYPSMESEKEEVEVVIAPSDTSLIDDCLAEPAISELQLPE
jgi:hypothetical protein